MILCSVLAGSLFSRCVSDDFNVTQQRGRDPSRLDRFLQYYALRIRIQVLAIAAKLGEGRMQSRKAFYEAGKHFESIPTPLPLPNVV